MRSCPELIKKLHDLLKDANKLCEASDGRSNDKILQNLNDICKRGNLNDSFGACVFEKLVNLWHEPSQELQAAIIECYGSTNVKCFDITPFNFLNHLCKVCNQRLNTCLMITDAFYTFSKEPHTPYK